MAIIYGSDWKSIGSWSTGISLNAQSKIVGSLNRGGGLRGKVQGWSLASRRRFRRWLIEHEVRPEFTLYGVTLTIPGPALPIEQSKLIFDHWRKTLNHWSWGMVWRLETQKRGAAHWHGIIAANPKTHPWMRAAKLHCKSTDEVQLPVPYLISQAWGNSLDSIGAQNYNPPVRLKSGSLLAAVSGLSAWPGADKRACLVEVGDTVDKRWLWYLQDHASKRKQDQVPDTWGRHWGIVGRGCWMKAKAQTARVFSADWFSVRRWLSRMLTPSIPDARCPFKRRRGRKFRINARGRTDIFCNPATVARMMEQARKNYREKHGFDPAHLAAIFTGVPR